MPSKRVLLLTVAVSVVVSGLLPGTANAFAASKEKVLYRFSGNDGYNPDAGLIFDASGNLYGTTYNGGANNYGVVFQLTRTADGKWTEKVLYNFCSDNSCADGGHPAGALTLDVAGNFYGTAIFGGSGGCWCGVVFRLSPGASGTWVYNVLHSFTGKDGWEPDGDLIFDTAGNLYGTTAYGGAFYGSGSNGWGTVFELMPGAGGQWTEQVLHSFNNDGKDGTFPYGVVFDAQGRLYGTTVGGGDTGPACGGEGCGTVFELRPGAHGGWTERVVHNFRTGCSGSNPGSSLIFDAAGNLYGTTLYGGVAGCGSGAGCGTIFKLIPGANGRWGATVLHRFRQHEGFFPGNLIFDAAGNLYGMTYYGGPYGNGCNGYGCGVVFRLARCAKGRSRLTTLHAFGKGKDGSGPWGGLVMDATGNLYGTTYAGGSGCDTYGCGTVFETTP
jgi:uncharacterized repeat protein (TIGR03803 family)